MADNNNGPETRSEFEKASLEKLDTLVGEVQTLKSMMQDAALNADLRNLLQYTDFQLDLGELRTSKFDRRGMELIYEAELPNFKDVLPQILATFDESDSKGERAGPNDFSKIRNGYFRTMLMRYIAPGRVFCKNRKVFDICCGRGWGTVLLSRYAAEIDAIDIDAETIANNREYWKGFDVNWTEGNALDPTHFKDEAYDAVIGMEMLEHFTREEGEVLFSNILKAMKPGAYFLGSSAYPNNRAHADIHPALKTEGHKFLWSVPELKEWLSPYSESVSVISNWMLVFQKKNASVDNI